MSTYTDRRVERRTVTSLDYGVTFDDRSGFGPSEQQKAMLQVGGEYMIELRGFRITGIALPAFGHDGHAEVGLWLWRQSDEDLAAQHADMQSRIEASRAEELLLCSDDMTAREAALPDHLRSRLERFRENGGADFELLGWGYELVVCELAVLYEASGGADSDEIERYASVRGTSGNQHECAKALAASGPAYVHQMPAALSPLTGDPDYSRSGS